MLISVVGRELHFVPENDGDHVLLDELKDAAVRNMLDTSSDKTEPYGKGVRRWKVQVETI